jgi:hypothetical protein
MKDGSVCESAKRRVKSKKGEKHVHWEETENGGGQEGQWFAIAIRLLEHVFHIR